MALLPGQTDTDSSGLRGNIDSAKVKLRQGETRDTRDKLARGWPDVAVDQGPCMVDAISSTIHPCRVQTDQRDH